MGNFLRRLLASTLMIIARLIGVRAMFVLNALLSSPPNFLPARRDPSGCATCPPQTLFTGETEQILIILLSIIAIALACMLWRRAVIRPQ
jgi:hypothetical protein